MKNTPILLRTFPLLALLALAGCGQTEPQAEPQATAKQNAEELSPEELVLEAEADSSESDADAINEQPLVIPFSELKGDFELSLFREDAYIDEDARWVVDLVVGSFAMLPVVASNEAGSGISNMPLLFKTNGSLNVQARGDEEGKTQTNSRGEGVLVFDVTGEPREEIIQVTAAGQSMDIVVNVLSSQVNNYSMLNQLDDVVHWGDLVKAEVTYVPGGIQASYPPELAALHQTEVEIVGFMMPLDATPEQKHFVLTSSPPSCFYHIPGGIAGGVEVFTEDPIKVSWEPIRLKGKLKIYEQNSVGVIYQLLDASQEKLELPDPA